MPCRWTSSRCTATSSGRERRQDGDVQPVEARQRRAGHIVAAAQEPHQEVADDRHRPGDAGADFGREERQLVPRQQVAAEPEGRASGTAGARR